MPILKANIAAEISRDFGSNETLCAAKSPLMDAPYMQNEIVPGILPSTVANMNQPRSMRRKPEK